MITMTISTTVTAIELPTNRTSKYCDGPGPDVHDPNYIPVLNGAEIRVDFSKPSFSALPSIPTPHANASQSSLKRSKSGSAPEIAVEIDSRRSVRSRGAKGTKATIPSSPQELESSWDLEQALGKHDTASDTTEQRTTSDSDGSASQADQTYGENVFVIPGNDIAKTDIAASRLTAHSAKSSIASSKRVPTSRFNKRASVMVPLPQTNGLHTLIAVPAPTSLSVDNTHNVSGVNRTSRVNHTPQGSLPPPQLPAPTAQISSTIPIPPTPQDLPIQPVLRNSKSTASERRNRALHSHPSNQSLQSKAQSVGPETDEMPLIPPKSMTRSRPASEASSRSRAQSLCNSTQATPAPNAPLPDLPSSFVKRPPTRERPIEKPVAAYKLPESSKASADPEKSLEVSDLMASHKSVAFRRFDDVHVKLLLHLQKEIASLEKELAIIESGASAGEEQAKDKMSIMRELRKTVAEYDNIFSNWATMQANPATQEMRDKLAQWLQTPGSGPAQLSKGAREDIACLISSNDLSSISTDPEKKQFRTNVQQRANSEPATGGGRGGFLALFGCASKRK